MKYIMTALLFVACSTTTEPFYTPPECPDGFEPIEWSHMSPEGVETHGHYCVTAGALDSMFGMTTTESKDSTGSITIVIICPDCES